MQENNFDVVVIGGGPAGYVAAIRAAQLGMRTACVEMRKSLGGTCLNIGCIPSKALLDSSEHFAYTQHKLSRHGIMVEGVRLDLAAMMKRKNDVVRQLTQGVAGLLKKNKVEWILGRGEISGPGAVLVTTDAGPRPITAKNIIIATGSEPTPLASLPFDGRKILSSTEALEIPAVPKHLAVVGAGFIGLELGSVWLRLGAKVTVIEFQNRIVPAMDEQIANELQRSLTKQGMVFALGTKSLGARPSPNGLLLELEEVATQKRSQLECDLVLVATGRRPYTGGLGLEKIGVKLDPQGRIPVDAHFQSSTPGVYAIGDVIAGPMLAHKAEDEGTAVAEILAGQKSHVNYGTIPGVVYTWPEVASVGQTEQELKKSGVAYKVGTFPFLANGRAKAMDETEGLVKVIADATTDRVLGVHIFGPRASDMIPEAVAVMEYGGSAEDIARTCHAHPTLAETFKEAALAVDKRAIHI